MQTTIDLLDRPIAFQRPFVKFTKSIGAALFLSQAIYWTKRTKREDTWFYKTIAEWEDETGLTRYEQEKARRILSGLGILEEHKRGVPCRIWFRINTEKLEEHLGLAQRDFTTDKGLESIVGLWAPILARVSRQAHKRALKAGAQAEKVDYGQIFLRDKGQCHACGKPITLPPGTQGGSLQFECVVPLSEGGPFTPANVKLTHLCCRKRPANSSLRMIHKLDSSLRMIHRQGGGSSAGKAVDHPQTSKETEITQRLQHVVFDGVKQIAPIGAASPAITGSGDTPASQPKSQELTLQGVFEVQMMACWKFAFKQLSGSEGEYKPARADKAKMAAFFQVWGISYNALDATYVYVKAWIECENHPTRDGFDPYWKSRRALHVLGKFLDYFQDIKNEVGWDRPSDEEMKAYLRKTIKMVVK